MGRVPGDEMITKQQRQDAIRALVDLHGIRLGLPASLRSEAIWLALSTYRADESSAWRAVEDGRYLLNNAAEGYQLLDGLGHG